MTYHKYEPLPDSDDEYSDEDSGGEEESDGLEYAGDSETEGSRKRRRSMEPRRGKRRRLNEDNVGGCITPTAYKSSATDFYGRYHG